MLRSTYDVIIIGTDLPALIFGALAAKRGYRVLVLGHGGKENIYEVEGYRFVRRPHFLFGFADSTPIREVFRELALAPEMRSHPRPFSPTCSVILPDARIEVTHLKGVLEQELAREFPDRFHAFQDLLRRLPEVETPIESFLAQSKVIPPSTIREWFAYRRLRKVLAPLAAFEWPDTLASDPRARAFLAAPIAAMSGLQDAFTRALPAVRLSNHLLRGLYQVEWGLDALKALFLDRIRNNSGDVRLGDFVDMLVLKRGRVQEVEVRARDEALGVGVLVAGTRLSTCLDLIPEGDAKRRYHARVDRVKPTHYLVTVNIGSDREMIPEGMAQTAFLIADPNRPLEAENFLILQVDPAMEPADQADPARTTLAVSGLLPLDRFTGAVAPIQSFCEAMLKTLRTFMPFLDEHRAIVSPSAVGVDPKTGEPVVDRAGLQAVYANTVPRGLDLMTWPIHTAYKNLLFLGDDAAGSLGFEGAFIAAVMATEHLKRRLSLKNVMS